MAEIPSAEELDRIAVEARERRYTMLAEPIAESLIAAAREALRLRAMSEVNMVGQVVAERDRPRTERDQAQEALDVEVGDRQAVEAERDRLREQVTRDAETIRGLRVELATAFQRGYVDGGRDADAIKIIDEHGRTWKDRCLASERRFLTLSDDSKQLERDLAEAVAALRRARVDLENWSGYAGEYYKQKHGYAGDLAALDAVLAKHAGWGASYGGMTGGGA